MALNGADIILCLASHCEAAGKYDYIKNEIEQIYKAINAVSQKVNEVQKRLDDYITSQNNQIKSSVLDVETAICELYENTNK